jgi:hypothetical protein
VECKINGQRVLIGNKKFLNQHQIKVDPHHQRLVKQIYESGNSVLFVVLESELLGIVAVADTIKVLLSFCFIINHFLISYFLCVVFLNFCLCSRKHTQQY